MKKMKSAMLIAATVLASSVYAGGPDLMAAPANQNHHLFTTLEGGYTWNTFGVTSVTSHHSTDPAVTHIADQTNNGGTGRVAVGAIHYSTYSPKLSYTAEAGWGYYGKTSYTSALGGINAQNYIFGFDLLGGVDYQFTSKFDGFFKLGGLLENTRMDRNTDMEKYTGGNLIGIDTTKTTSSAILPELKVGGVYNITDAWGLSAAYMYAYGNGNVSMHIDKSPTLTNSTSTDAPASLSTILFGIQYKFA